jgi:glycosyltransferase involved in cell wall biosynthesis
MQPPMANLSLDIVNDQHVFSGTYTHIIKIYENLRNHGYDSNFFHFSLQNDEGNLPKNAVIKKGIFSFLNSKYSFTYNLMLGANFLTGMNWKSFKNLHGDVQILSGPTLLPLAKYYKNTIAIGHDLYFFDNKGRSAVERTYMKRMYALFGSPKFIIVDSEFTKTEFLRRLKLDENKTGVVYPTFDSSIFHPGRTDIKNLLGINDGDKILLSVGGDNPNKNIETIIRLLAILPKNFKLVRVGRNFRTMNMINDFHLNNRVLLLGNVELNFLSELYRAANIFLFPSLFEGFGIPVVEAMASGTPVITSNRTSLPEIVGYAGIMSDPFDIDFMRDSIMKITEDDSFKDELVRKGLERAKIFSSQRQFKSLKNIINQVCEEG